MESSEKKAAKPKRVVVEEIIASDEEKETIKTEVPVKPPIPEPARPRSSNLYLWVLIPGTLLLILLVGGIIVYQVGLNKVKTKSLPTPQAAFIPQNSTVPTPSQTPTAKIDLKKYSITILNGSGKIGEAGKAQDLLEAAGFKVSKVGNAKTYDYTKTVIQAKEGVDQGFINQLKTTLSKSYSVEDKSLILSASSKDEVVVTVGAG